MKRIVIKVIVIIAVVITVSCGNDDGINVPLNNEVNEFVWQGMRTFYFWESEVPDLAQGRFATFDQLHTFLNGFNTPEQLFDHFLFSGDRFSWIADDYFELENSLQGISKSFGYEFSLVQLNGSSNVFGYVEYVLPNSPAEQVGLKRGDVFFEVDGTQITVDNFSNLLFGQDNISLSLGIYINRDSQIGDLNKTVSMTSVEIPENPVFLSEVLEVQGIKVGYLVYNQFVNTYHRDLNEVFGQFMSEGITELVLDLRYNPGGSVTTARLLASMIYGSATGSTTFGSIFYNDNLAEFNSDINFLDQVPIFNADGDEVVSEEPMNQLNLNRIFILTTRGTASASELIIAGLDPFMEVVQIGDTTIGKNVGSITLYDSPDDGYTERDNVNPNHRYALQPIISQLANSQGFSDYIDGLVPDVLLEELDFAADLKPLGDLEEPFLTEALGIITGVGRIEKVRPSLDRKVFNSKERNPHLFRSHLDLQKISLSPLP